MSTMEMYTPKFEALDIFKALKKAKSDEVLPEGGVFDFFYQKSLYPGISLFLKHKKKIKLFYVDHDDFIVQIKDQIPEWNINSDKNLLRISLIYKIYDTIAPITFVFDLSDKSYIDLITVIRNTKEIKLYYLTMLYGGLVFDSYIKLKIPSDVKKFLKQVK